MGIERIMHAPNSPPLSLVARCSRMHHVPPRRCSAGALAVRERVAFLICSPVGVGDSRRVIPNGDEVV